MNFIDRVLEKVQHDVETRGKSGGSTVFLTNVSFTIPANEFVAPIGCDVEGAICDVSWFFKCAREKRIAPCGNPDISFFIKFFGANAQPYGNTWDLKQIKEDLGDLDTRRAVLVNYSSESPPPCITSYQFQCVNHGALNCTVTMRSSDVANVLAEDVFMSGLILQEICSMVDMEPGSLTFNIGNAHVYYKDLRNPEEFAIDYGD